MLKHFYRVETDVGVDQGILRPSTDDPKTMFDQSEVMKNTWTIAAFQGTVLRSLCFDAARWRKLKRANRMMTKVESHLEKSLDVRTLLRTQTLLKTIMHVFFDKKHRPLIKL